MKITKAVITAAGEHHSNLPLQSVVDRAGNPRTAMRLTLDEIIQAGIEDIAIIVRPGQSGPYLEAAGIHASRLVFFEQDKPEEQMRLAKLDAAAIVATVLSALDIDAREVRA